MVRLRKWRRYCLIVGDIVEAAPETEVVLVGTGQVCRIRSLLQKHIQQEIPREIEGAKVCQLSEVQKNWFVRVSYLHCRQSLQKRVCYNLGFFKSFIVRV